MPISIRSFTPTSDSDYQLIADLGNSVYPHMLRSAAELRHWIESRPDHMLTFRYLAEDAGGAPIGLAFVGHMLFGYRPEIMLLDVIVLESYRRQGVGSALYDKLTTLIPSLDLTTIRCSAREDKPDGLRFATKRGFVEDMREWESVLDMSQFDPQDHAAMGHKAEEAGIVIRSVQELMSQVGWERKLYALESVAALDVPSPDPIDPDSLSFDTFESTLLKSPNFLPEGFFVAMDGDKLVGSSNLWSRDADDHLMTGLTAVLREYRRKGIASALKLRALTFAKEQGTPFVHTDNATINRPMLAINEALGFEKQPATILMSRKLREELGDAPKPLGYFRD